MSTLGGFPTRAGSRAPGHVGPETIRRVTRVAVTQHGAVAARQVIGHGITAWQWRSLRASGWLIDVAPGVAVVAGSPDTWDRRLSIGLLWLGDDAMISHRAAAAVHGFDRARRDAVEFQVPRGDRGRRGPFTVHTTAHLEPLDVVVIDARRVTSATRTVLDLARLRVPNRELEGAVDSAVRSGRSSPIVLADRLGGLRGRGRWGCRAIDELLVDAGGHSPLERRFLWVLRHHGLPRPRAQMVHRLRGAMRARVDFDFDPYPVIVEVNGDLGHATAVERARDAQRRNELQAIGRVVLEFTWHQVTRTPRDVARSVERHLRRAGWPGGPPHRH